MTRNDMKKILFGAVLLAAAFALELPVRGASDNAWFAARRAALMKRLEGGVAALQGAPETRAYERFRQGNDFYYLTGVETPGAMVLIDAARNRSVLFLPPRNVQAEGWEGPKLSPGEDARAATGFDEVLEIARFGAALESACAGGKGRLHPVPARGDRGREP